jgi:hypothetical protein
MICIHEATSQCEKTRASNSADMAGLASTMLRTGHSDSPVRSGIEQARQFARLVRHGLRGSREILGAPTRATPRPEQEIDAQSQILATDFPTANLKSVDNRLTSGRFALNSQPWRQ